MSRALVVGGGGGGDILLLAREKTECSSLIARIAVFFSLFCGGGRRTGWGAGKPSVRKRASCVRKSGPYSPRHLPDRIDSHPHPRCNP